MVAVAKQVQSTGDIRAYMQTRVLSLVFTIGSLEKKKKETEARFLTTAKTELHKSVSIDQCYVHSL